MPVPAEGLMKAVKKATEAYQVQIENYIKLNEISEHQLDLQMQITTELEGKCEIQERYIATLTEMNDRYEALLAERDAFIQSLR